jgi:cell division protein FtsB
MRTNQPELIERVTVRLNRATVTAIQKSGQSASDWLRQAVRSRLESERQTGATAGAEEKQLEALKQNGADLRKEIAKLQQSESIVQAALLELRRTLTAIQQHQAAAQHNTTTSSFAVPWNR